MAGSVEEDTEYESDPEEAKLALAMRRREASDEEEEDNERDRPPVSRIGSRNGIGSDEDSDGRGAPADYNEQDSEIDDEEEDLEDYGEDEEYVVGGTRGGVEVEGGAFSVVSGELVVGREGAAEKSRESEVLNNLEEGNKEIEPFAVPTAGAFYMHDDRFRGSNGVRSRQMFGGKRLWESKDDKKWSHDKFEEIILQERHYEEGRRNSRGRFRGRGNHRRPDCGYPRGNKSNEYGNNSQSLGPKVRGRGPIRYTPSEVTYKEASLSQEKRRSGNVTERTSHTKSGKTFASVSNSEYDPVPPARKQVVASSLNIASPPFYPSGSSCKEPASMQKKDVRAGATNLNVRSSVLSENVLMSQSNSMVRGKNVEDFIGMERLYINDSVTQYSGNPSATQLFPPGSSFVSPTQPLQARVQGNVLTPSVHLSLQPGAPFSQVNRGSPPPQLHSLQQSPAQNQNQPSLLAQQFGQRPRTGSQNSSPPKAAVAPNYSEPREMVSLPESGKSKTLVAKGNTTGQGSGRGSIPLGGAQVMGATSMGTGRSDQNFAATPAFLQVMPFGGQHPSGMVVPAVGMALPGYIAQPHPVLGSSEMTWLPVLASPAGALGATYGSPYIAFDGACHSFPPGQTSTSDVPRKGNDANKPINDWKPSPETEVMNDGSGQRQKHTRRYTEMNFGR